MTQPTPLPKYLEEAELEAAIHGIAKHHAERSQFLFLILLLLGVWGMWLRSQPVQDKKAELRQPTPQTLTYPIQAPITSGYGMRIHPITGAQKMHNGIDFGAAQGTPISAAASGKVVLAGWVGGYGNSVEIDHQNGLKTFYAHASVLYIQNGQAVKTRQAIAAVGSTGNSTGPHLHFEVRKQGQWVDPMKFLEKEDASQSVGEAGKKR